MRKTKIIATLGPATSSREIIAKLIDAGMNVARLNMSHAPHDWVRQIVADIRSIAAEKGAIVGILMDTQGPAIRTGDLPADLNLEVGQKFTLTVRGEVSEELHSVDVNYENFVNDISVGDVVLVDNGEIHMKVLAKHANKVECEVLTPGKLGSRRHINLPGVKVSLPPLTDKDRKDIDLGLELGVDFIALSFVREPGDVKLLREIVNRSPQPPNIVAKIEDQEAVRNFDEIATVADAIMVARGDLGIECPFEELPIIQRRLVKTCQMLGKPVIVATHMLESMIENPVPTRAEITDVANAVFEQADAIMLSGETTVGKYPVKCVEMFDRIARRIERSGGAHYHEGADIGDPRQMLARSAVMLANELKAEAILLFTNTGSMARYASWHRPHYSTIFAICSSARLAARLILNWGVYPKVTEFGEGHPEATMDRVLRQLIEGELVHRGNKVVEMTGVITGGKEVSAILSRQVD